jgi:hypothetical protein
MKRRCTGTIPKQKLNRRSGWENRRRDPKSTSVSIKCEGVVDIFVWKGVVHREFVPRGHTTNGQIYLDVMKRLREAERRKRAEKWRNKTWMLHHNNTPANTSLLVHEFLAKHETTVVLQPHYSPDLAPVDFLCTRSRYLLWKVADFRR